MTELTHYISYENSRLSMQIYFITVFVKIASAEYAQSNAYRVLTQVNSNLTVTIIFEQKTF